MARPLERLLDRHQRGTEDATDRIWRLLNLQIWGNIFLTGNARDLRTPDGGFRNDRRMKILWVKTNFLHPTTKAARFARSRC